VTVSVQTRTDLSVHGPTVGFAGQLGVLGALAATVGLGPAGWLAGLAYGVVAWLTLSYALHRTGTRSLGAANIVTLARGTLGGGVTALVADSLVGPTPDVVVVTLVAVTAVALALDFVDGLVARRTGSTSALGARFDMETDAFLILVLSVFVAQSLGAWVLAIGAVRYAFVAAGWLLPWLTAPLPPKMSRKTVAATQGIVLLVASAGVLPVALDALLVGLSLTVLAWSFTRDVWWLWRHRPAWVAPAARWSAP